MAKELARNRLSEDRRENSNRRGYTWEWRAKKRVAVLKSEPLCRKCSEMGRVTPATHVHHIDENPRNNERKNLMPLCFECHERLHGRIR